MAYNTLTNIQAFENALIHREEFLTKCGHLEATPSSMLPSEILIFIATCRESGVEIVIESGRSYGYSTRCILSMGLPVRSFDCSPQWAVDKEIKDEFPETAELCHASCPAVIAPTKKFGLLMDGPKGREALAIIDSSNPTVVGLHDCYVGSDARQELGQRQWAFTENLDVIPDLDMRHLEARGYKDRSVLSEAFVLGLAKMMYI